MTAQKMKRMESTAPARIFLIVDPAGSAYGMGDTFPEHGLHVGWDAESCGGVEVEYVRKAEHDARNAELTAELDKSRRALLKIREIAWLNDANTDFSVIYNIARNALREG